MSDEMDAKECCRCHKVRPPTDFNLKGKPHPEGLRRGACRECESDYWKGFYQKNRRRELTRVMYFQAKHPEWDRERRARYPRGPKDPDRERERKRRRRFQKAQSAAHYTQEQWKELQAKYGNICLRCGQCKTLVADHVVPLALGGADSIDNIQPLCADCNAWKNVQIVDYRIRAAVVVEQLSFIIHADQP